MPLTIEEIQEQAKELASHFNGVTLERRVAFLVTEVGEVAQEVLSLSGAYNDADREAALQNLGLEMYDVLWNLCDLANMVGIDLDEAARRKIEINRQREW
ncbi:MAG: hypothetical protein D6737_17045 [Chloroflexi bacterium]|nr:MAG: hypothetical protein D6737_17045 [Chloroflexota bacterium]